ncbi:GNAT family N-acetyltransferase, partial [Bacillus amyloliquefaciens]|uniref:GNAT family N-acetyltransferase n=1 Tax=Bacillus amyloliquefaciens TaxID=1390 RepID=UPI0023EE12F0
LYFHWGGFLLNYIWNNETLSLYDGDTLVAENGFLTIAVSNKYVFERTLVCDAYRGHGIAGKITTTFITRVQEEGKKLLPLCTYTNKFMQKHPEYADLLAKK